MLKSIGLLGDCGTYSRPTTKLRLMKALVVWSV